MTDETLLAVIESVVERPTDFIVYANNPADMSSAQTSLIQWSGQKIEAERGELAEAQRNFQAAKTHKWSTAGWGRQVKKHNKRIEFYEKIEAALKAGYYIVPPFPIDLFAIRTDQRSPKVGYKRNPPWQRDQYEQKASVLPAGEGEYVSPDPTIVKEEWEESDDKGGTKLVPYWSADEWKEVDFPFKLAKAEILGATRAALALKIFDQMGALPTHRAPDPIICGQILYPEKQPYGPRRALTFFVTWWLDTRTI